MMTEQEKGILSKLKKLTKDEELIIGFMCLIRNEKKHDEAEKWLIEHPNATDDDIFDITVEMM